MARARLAMLENRLADAASLFDRAWGEEPECYEACSLSGWCLLRAHGDDQSRLDEALEQLHTAALLSHGDALCTLRLGMGLELLGQTERAIQQLKDALKADPTLREAQDALKRLERPATAARPASKGGLGGLLGSLFTKD